MQVTYSHIKQVKRIAKALKDTYPSLKLGQRQDKAAIQELGVRNYHEANRLYEQWLMVHVHTSPDSDGVSKCSFCEFSFAADLKEDREAHRDVHERFHEASEALGYTVPTAQSKDYLKPWRRFHSALRFSPPTTTGFHVRPKQLLFAPPSTQI
ncbi:hypothetical protein QEP73_17205 [Pseudomonas defluvii]|nr:hypothetical protein QEP73_17205 [Pseudomonas defluvii]